MRRRPLHTPRHPLRLLRSRWKSAAVDAAVRGAALTKVKLSNLEATNAFAARLARELRAGTTVLLDGPLGVGKTTLVRGVMRALDFDGDVVSPTYNLLQVYDTVPPVLHADLYRVADWRGIGLEDYLDSHVVLIEWPDRAIGLVDRSATTRISLEFDGDARIANILRPGEPDEH